MAIRERPYALFFAGFLSGCACLFVLLMVAGGGRMTAQTQPFAVQPAPAQPQQTQMPTPQQQPGEQPPQLALSQQPPPSWPAQQALPQAPRADIGADHSAPLIAGSTDLETLRRRGLTLPVMGVHPNELTDTFGEARGTGSHEALDIIAPRSTPVLAADDGTIAKLFTSVRGGITIYQFDRTQTYCYYYAHLERYAPNVADGQAVKKGQVIGYVGTTGNAPANTPHLHFAIYKLGPDKKWWDGTPINPFSLWR